MLDTTYMWNLLKIAHARQDHSPQGTFYMENMLRTAHARQDRSPQSVLQFLWHMPKTAHSFRVIGIAVAVRLDV